MLIKTKYKLATSLRVFLFPWSIRHSQFPWLYLKQYTTTVYLSRGTGHLMWTYHPLEVKDREWSLQTNIILQYMQLWLQRFFFNWLMLWFLSCCSETRHWTMAFSLPTEPTTKKKKQKKKTHTLHLDPAPQGLSQWVRSTPPSTFSLGLYKTCGSKAILLNTPITPTPIKLRLHPLFVLHMVSPTSSDTHTQSLWGFVFFLHAPPSRSFPSKDHGPLISCHPRHAHRHHTTSTVDSTSHVVAQVLDNVSQWCVNKTAEVWSVWNENFF